MTSERRPYRTLDDLTDVTVSEPADGDVLTYVAADDMWVNATHGVLWAVYFQEPAQIGPIFSDIDFNDPDHGALRLSVGFTPAGTGFTADAPGLYRVEWWIEVQPVFEALCQIAFNATNSVHSPNLAVPLPLTGGDSITLPSYSEILALHAGDLLDFQVRSATTLDTDPASLLRAHLFATYVGPLGA